MPDFEIKRENGGKWAKGQTGNKNGRRGYGYETKFRKIFSEVFDEPTIKAACIQLKSHIFGQKVDIKTGKVVDDPLATPSSCIAAFTKMAEYAGGKPVQFVVAAQDEDGELMNLLKSMAQGIQTENDDKLDEIVEQAKKHLEKLNVQPT